MMNWRWTFLSGVGVFTLLAVFVGMYVYGIPKEQAEEGQWVTHTYEVLNRLEILSGQLNAASAPGSSEPIQQTLTAIETLTEDNPRQKERIPLLRQSISSLFNTPAGENRKAFESIGQQIEAMRQEEKRLLEEREARWRATMARTRLLFLSGTVVLYLLALIAYLASRKEARSREQLLELESETADIQRGIATRMTHIVEIQQDIIAQRLSLDNAMQVITSRTQSITHADGAVVEMLEGNDMVYRAASGNMKPYIGFKIKAQGSLSGLCVASAGMLRCDDSDTDSRVDKEACRKVNVRSMIVVPLIHQGKTVGVLKVASSRPHAFTAEDMGTLQIMAGVLSVTLRDAIASDTLQDSNKYLNMSNEILKTQKAQLESEKSEWKSRADTDGMTGLKNHRYFQEYMAQEYLRAKRYKNALSLIMIDIDHFKQFNDDFGHPAGDEVIKQVAAILKNCVRPSDCAARYGGEEFAVILTQTPEEGALTTAERIRQAILSATWKKRPVTISIGISCLRDDTQDALTLINQADKALYQSKMEGRDKITSFAA